MDVKGDKMSDVKDVKEVNELTKETLEKTDNEQELSDSSPEEFGDLFGTTDNKIPYSRFKEVNDERKALKAELENVKSSVKTQVEDIVLKEQMKALTQQSKQDELSFDDLDPIQNNSDISVLKEELNMLKNQLKTVSEFTENNVLNQNLQQLKSAFPGMNEEHVLALKKMHPNSDLEECAKYSHDKFTSHTKKLYNQMIEEKKVAQSQKSVLGAERIRNLKPEEQPKDLEEARVAFMKFMKE